MWFFDDLIGSTLWAGLVCIWWNGTWLLHCSRAARNHRRWFMSLSDHNRGWVAILCAIHDTPLYRLHEVVSLRFQALMLDECQENVQPYHELALTHTFQSSVISLQNVQSLLPDIISVDCDKSICLFCGILWIYVGFIEAHIIVCNFLFFNCKQGAFSISGSLRSYLSFWVDVVSCSIVLLTD